MKKRFFAGAAAALCCAGLAMAQPANDTCANAIPVLIPSVTNGTTVGATVDTGAPTCVTSYSAPGVWYTLVGNGNTLAVDICTSSYDTKLHVYCTSSMTPCSSLGTLACVTGNDDNSTVCTTHGAGSAVTFCSAAGQTYYILVSGFSAATGTFTLNVADGAACSTAVSCLPPGACCSSTGTCSLTAQASCTGTSTFVGGACSPNPCTALLGACCNDTTGVCSSRTPNGCAAGSSFLGAGSACTPQPGPCAGAGACCTSSGSCSITSAGGCTATTSFFVGAGTVCTPANACTPLLGACCSTTGSCSSTIQQGCTGTSTFQGAGTTCTPTNPCGGACCNGTTCTVTVNAAACTTGIFTAGSLCSPNSCSGACCSSTGVCTVTGPGACTGTFTSSVTCTPTPGPCVQSGGPANDLCANAIMISAASLPATADGDDTLASTDPMPAVCASSQKDVWYTFTPMISQNYSVRTCGGLTGSLDTVLSVHTACPTVFANNLLTGACNDDGCSGVGASQISSIALNAGTTYWVRVARFGTTSGSAGGPFTLTIDEITGSCCNPTSGVCSITSQTGCGAGAWTVGATCTTSTCSGACCDGSTGACATLASTSGCSAGSTYQGAGSTCSPNPCPQFSGACCSSDGSCGVASPLDCTGSSVYLGNGTTCQTAVGCPATGACCAASGSCTVTFQANCTGTSQWTSGGACDPSPCVVGACCNGISCSVVTDFACAGDYLGDNIACEASTCTIGACCIASSATCIQTNATLCANAGGVYSGDGTVCSNLTVGSPLFSSGNTFPIAIPDGNATGVTATIVIPAGSGTVSGLNVAVGLTHTWVGDLIVTLSNGSTTVTLINRPGSVGGSFGYSTDIGGQYVFTDAAPTSFATAAAPGPALAAGAYKPAQALSAFDGAPFEGTWTLTVSDNAGGDTGNIGGLDFVSVTVTPTCEFSGACCCGSSCSLTTAAACTGTNSVFSGSGTVCNVPGNISSPCCLADYNHAGGVSVQDIFDFLAGYFSSNPCADINGGGTSVQDIFDFLAAYFSGGCM